MKQKVRHLIQLVSAVLINGYAVGFQKGVIFQGKTKMVCVPVLNCYSCPGALGACPIGALQAVLGDRKHHASFYVLGLLMLFGVVLGRLICGLLCPFGFVQELLYKIPAPKPRIPQRADRMMRCFKYAVFALFVVAGPLLLTDRFGIGSPYFCKLICPAGTLEGGLPLVSSNPTLRNTVGWLFSWKCGILVLVIAASVFIYRPFCKYLCPLGAFYAIFSRFSFYQLRIDHSKCVGCGVCERVCKMQVRLMQGKDMGECIRCGECQSACPKGAIVAEFFGKPCGGCVKKEKTTERIETLKTKTTEEP